MKRFHLACVFAYALPNVYAQFRGNKIACRIYIVDNSVLCYTARPRNIDFSSDDDGDIVPQDFRCTNTPLFALKLASRILSSSYRSILANPKVIQENGFAVTANLLIRNPCRKLHRVATCCTLLSCEKTISAMILFSRTIMPFITGSSIHLAISQRF